MTAQLQKKLKVLNNKWHGAIANAMGIKSDENFQIAQGDLGLSSPDSSALFLMSDAVPPVNVAGYYTVDYSNRISSSYGSLLVSLSADDKDDLKTLLGDNYLSWIEYKYKIIKNRTNTLNSLDIFKQWSKENLSADKMEKGLSIVDNSKESLLNKALDSYVDPSNKEAFLGSDQKQYYLHKYSLTIDEAKKAVNIGESIDNFSFDSTIAEVDSKKMDESIHTSGVWDAFSAVLDVSFESLIGKFLESKITVEARIDKYAKVPTNPVGWYNSEVTNRGFKNKDDSNVWDVKAQQGWNDFFQQPDGGLARHIDQFLLVSGYEITVKFHSTFTKEEFESFKAKATFSLWPFFSASLTITHKTDFILDKDGSLSYTIKSNPGDVKILGVTYKSYI